MTYPAVIEVDQSQSPMAGFGIETDVDEGSLGALLNRPVIAIAVINSLSDVGGFNE